MAACYKNIGDDENYIQMIGRALPLLKNETEYDQACFYAIYGNTDKAIALLKIAIEKNQTTLDWLNKDPDMDFIRDNPKFKEIIEK